MKKFLWLILFIFFITNIYAVQSEPRTFSDGTVTILKSTTFPQTISILETMAEQHERKKIINLTPITDPINLPINNLNWKAALQLIAKFHNLTIEELPSAYVLKIAEEEEGIEEDEFTKLLHTKQVRISSVFFKVDRSFLNSVGIDWSTLINGSVEASVGFKGGSQVASDMITASGGTRIESGDIRIDINALLKVIESYELGSVIARPNIVVLSGKSGAIQVGEDFSVKTADDAGNISDEFFSTGIIMKVKPTIIGKGEHECVYLTATVEKSSAVPGDLSTVVHKSESQTELILFHGEETVIGGLYDTDFTTTRSGIPLLKDLPWWVFGLRYLTGYSKKQKTVRELIIIIKAEIIDPHKRNRDQLSTEKIIQNEKAKNKKMDSLQKSFLKEKNE
ncbi:MAG: hypothetical protein U9P79_04130 [Candidatus Cloacimonadota bacterium]|nr:hypothetical protein [Candidatus Cloacimonadota bacterium]